MGMEELNEKYIEIKSGKRVDRYHLFNISNNDFIDFFYQKKIDGQYDYVKDITKEKYLEEKNHEVKISTSKFDFEQYCLSFNNHKEEISWKYIVDIFNQLGKEPLNLNYDY